MEIGGRLKEAREAQNISLDSLQETTKIQKRYLAAIEEGNLHILPGKFYARAFIKEYATAVGLDPDELLEGHKDEVPGTETKEDLQYTRIQRSKQGSRTSSKSPVILSIIPTVIVILLVIGIVIVAWTLYQKAITNGNTDPIEEQNNDEIIRNNDEGKGTNDVSDETEEDPEDPEKSNDDDDKEEVESELPQEFVLVEEGTGNRPESTYEFNNPDETIQLKLISKGNTWLEVENGDGESLYKGEFSEDQSPKEIDISDEDRIYFSMGFAPDLQIIVNDVELEYMTDPNAKVVQKVWININKETE